MCSDSPRLIVINGVRYNVAIRLDTSWSYIAEWRTNTEYHKHTPDETVKPASAAEREAIDQIHNSHLNREPWLHVEMA